jgi:transglutaminase/protease-like cytokinesis protein 3
MGFKSEVLRGFSKGFGYEHGAVFEEIDHAWSTVEIRGEWYLVDATWSNTKKTGELDVTKEEAEKERKINNFYFLSDPEEFVYSHLPKEDTKWTL